MTDTLRNQLFSPDVLLRFFVIYIAPSPPSPPPTSVFYVLIYCLFVVSLKPSLGRSDTVVREADILEWMELQELGRELVRNVGLVETNRQEEGSALILPEELLRHLGDLDVGQRPAGLVGHLHGAEHVGVPRPVQV